MPWQTALKSNKLDKNFATREVFANPSRVSKVIIQHSTRRRPGIISPSHSQYSCLTTCSSMIVDGCTTTATCFVFVFLVGSSAITTSSGFVLRSPLRIVHQHHQHRPRCAGLGYPEAVAGARSGDRTRTNVAMSASRYVLYGGSALERCFVGMDFHYAVVRLLHPG